MERRENLAVGSITATVPVSETTRLGIDIMGRIDASKIKCGTVSMSAEMVATSVAEDQETEMTNVYAFYSACFTMAIISVDERGSVLLFDKADADCLKLCVDHLKTKSDDARIEFYRMLLDNRPLRGPDGILSQLH